MKRPGKRGQPHVALNITKRCNQRCVFCFEGDRSSWREPSLAEVKRLLVETAKTHQRVIFMGAEALLREDIVEVVRFTCSLGLTLSIFSNGQALARAGFIEQLAAAGLRELDVSFHYADADSFAAGTRTPPQRFDRLLRGLSLLREHNRSSPEQRILVKVETELFALNSGKLERVRELLQEVLGDELTAHRIGTVQPCDRLAEGGSLLEPLAARRDELVAFLDAHRESGDISLIKLPLCLAPGYEHLSFDAAYRLAETDVRSNFEDKRRLDHMHRPVEMYLRNPYRWVCRGCNLLPLCASERTSWTAGSSPPRPDQKPFPVHETTLAEVASRAMDARPSDEQLRRLLADWRSIPVPEAEILRSLEAVSTEGFELLGCSCDGAPILDLDLRAAGNRLRVRLAPVGAHPRRERAFVVRYLEAVVLAPDPPPARSVTRVLKRLATLAFPPLSDWESQEPMARAPAHQALTLWHLFSARLWPGEPFVGGWTTRALVPAAGAFRLRLRAAGSGQATLLLHVRTGGETAPARADPAVAIRTPGLLVGLEPAESSGEQDLSSERAAALLLAVEQLLRQAGEAPEPPLAARNPAAAVAARRAEPAAGFDQPTPYGDQPGTLRVRFSDRQGKVPDLAFLLKAARPGERFYALHNGTGLAYVSDATNPAMHPRRAEFRACVATLVWAMRASSAPPGTENGGDWESLIQQSLRRGPLQRRFRCRVEQRR